MVVPMYTGRHQETATKNRDTPQMQPSIPAKPPYRIRASRVELLHGDAWCGDTLAVLRWAVIESEGRPRADVWAQARAAAHQLASMAALSEEAFAAQAVKFVRRFGLLIGGINDWKGDNFPFYGGLLSNLVRQLMWELTGEHGETIRRLEYFRERRTALVESGQGTIFDALRLRHTDPGSWDLWDLSDARLDELRRGASWTRTKRLVDQIQESLDRSVKVDRETGMRVLVEPVAVYRLASNVLADLTTAGKPFHEIEMSIRIAGGILKTGVLLVPNTSSRPSPPLPLNLEFQCWTWLSAIVLAALTEGPIDLRRCAYRNCINSFPAQPSQRRYCSDACGSSERSYRSRGRRPHLTTDLTT